MCLGIIIRHNCRLPATHTVVPNGVALSIRIDPNLESWSDKKGMKTCFTQLFLLFIFILVLDVLFSAYGIHFIFYCLVLLCRNICATERNTRRRKVQTNTLSAFEYLFSDLPILKASILDHVFPLKNLTFFPLLCA